MDGCSHADRTTRFQNRLPLSRVAAYLAFKDAPEVQQWLSGPFFKAVCKVSPQEFEQARSVADNVILTESALDGQEVAIAFKPREEWPKSFKFFRLFK